MGDTHRRMEEAALSGGGSEMAIIRRVDPINRTVPWDGVMCINKRGDFEEWLSIPLGTVATRIASKRWSREIFYHVMLSDGREVITCSRDWEPV